MIITGRVWQYGDNIDTDVIIPARYLTVSKPDLLVEHCMEDLDPGFASAVQPGDIIVAGSNFGCGSSREHAPLVLKTAGIACIVAVSFARIFYRNAINIGLPILECPAAVRGTQSGDSLEVNLRSGTITNVRSGSSYQALPFSPFILEIIEAGGLVPYTRKRLGAQSKDAAQSPSLS